MKKYAFITAITLAIGTLTGCSKLDNFAEPKSELTGRVVYQGTPIEVEHNQVWLQLWDPGLGKLASINTRVKQDGTFSELLFNRNYKIVFPAGRGPFKTIQKDAATRDTLYVNLSGKHDMDIEVTPYYMLRNPQFTSAERRVTGTFQVEQILKGTDARNIERITLYVNKTQFVSGATNIAATNIPVADIAVDTPLSLTVTVPAISPTQNYVYARIGLKIAGIEQLIFTPAEKVNI